MKIIGSLLYNTDERVCLIRSTSSRNGGWGVKNGKNVKNFHQQFRENEAEFSAEQHDEYKSLRSVVKRKIYVNYFIVVIVVVRFGRFY